MASLGHMDHRKLLLEDAWNELHEANVKPSWFVGQPAYEPRLAVPWSIYGFDPAERPKTGRRSREWTATGMTQELVVREMARCLREIADGRVPK